MASSAIPGPIPAQISAAGPLAGITVIDLSRVLAGPYATMLLSDLGARVLKVERPVSGDDSRHIGPFKADASGQAMSAYFTSINRAKESIALDLRNEADREIFEALLASADVLVENFRPGVMEKLGYGWPTLNARYPRLIYAATSGFGLTGPEAHKPAYDIVVQGMGGVMSITGHPGGPPTRVGTSFGDIVAGMFTTMAIEAALLARQKTGAGQLVDVAMLDGQIAMLENAIVRYELTGQSPGPLGARHPSITPFGAFCTQDGYIILAAGNEELWDVLVQTLGNETIKNDPDFATNDLRCQHVTRLTAVLEAQLKTRPTADWLEIFSVAKLPCGPINTVGQAINQPQVRARTMLVQTGFEDGSPLSVAGNPMKFSAHADLAVRTKAPRLDEHRASILQGLHHGAALSDAWVRFAQTLADKSGIIARHYFRKSMDFSDKNDASPVTIADREIEEALRLMIRTAFPEHGICGEEFGQEQAGAPWQWVIDPIDGTRAFLAGRPTFATLIALLKDGVPVLGVIDQPIVGDRWLGVSGAATRHNGVVCQSNAQATLAQARLSTTGPNYFDAQEAACYERLRAAIGMSLWGGDGYAYGLLASGYSDIIVEAGLKCHDFAALVPIVVGAGGAMVDWQGEPLHAQSRGQVIAVGNKALLDDILPIFSSQ